MSGIVRKRTPADKRGGWGYRLEVGEQDAQRCDACGARYWLDEEPLEACAACGGALSDIRARRQISRGGFRTSREAHAALAVARVGRDGGEPVPRKDTKERVGEHLRTWLIDVKDDVRPTTWRSYEMHVYKYLIPRLGALPLRRLTTTRINATYRELREGGRLKDSTRPLSALTVRHTHAVLRLALKEAVAAGKIPSNPAIGAKLPHDRGEKREMVTWTATQLMAFLDFTSDSRMADFWRVAAFTGLRRGELAGLQWHDVTWPIDDEAAGGLRIRRSRVSVGGKATDSLPKTEAGGRDVAIDPGVIDALRRQRARQLADAAKWGAAWQDSAHVFTIENGQPLHPERISFLFDEAVAAAKVPRIRLHDLRHTHATMALEAGVPVKIVSQRLGHSSTRITQDVYQHVLKEQQQDAAQAIADYVKRSSTPLHAVPRDDQEKAR